MKTLLLLTFLLLLASMFLFRIPLKQSRRPEYILRGVQLALGFLVIVLHGGITLGLGDTLLFLGIAMAVGFLMEILGITRGWIFGRYHYAESAGPRFFGILPVFAPLLWSLLAYMAYWMTDLIIGGSKEEVLYKILFTVTGALLVLLVDIVAEPIAVDEGRWHWEKKGRYYGIPFSNFIGWFVTAWVIFTLQFLLVEARPDTAISPWITYLPALGYVIFMVLCARVCFERKLMLAGVAGMCAAAVLLLWGVTQIIV